MPLTKVTGKGLNDSVVDSTKLGTSSVTETKIADSAVTSAKISDGVVSADDLSSSLNLSSKTITLPSASVTAAMLSSTLDLSSKTVTLPLSATATLDQNIALLGFKMAITDGLTVFNLVDGVVDEFEDESGTDGSASTNLTYNSTDDYYINSNSPDGGPFAGSPVSYSAGFSNQAITEPDTSVAGTNNFRGSGTPGTFTVPVGMTSVNIYAWGAGGGGSQAAGGAGGFASGTFATSPGQVLQTIAGEGGYGYNCTPAPLEGGYYGSYNDGVRITGSFGGDHPQTPTSPAAPAPLGGIPLARYTAGPGAAGTKMGALGGYPAGGAGLAFVGTGTISQSSAPNIVIIAGGGGSGGHAAANPTPQFVGGAGGGLTGQAGGGSPAQTNWQPLASGGGGSQTIGGQGQPQGGGNGGFLHGSTAGPQSWGMGGAGYYGGGGSSTAGPGHGAGGGGSSYYGHPQVTGGTTEGGSGSQGGGTASPLYPSIDNFDLRNEGGSADPNPYSGLGQDGYVLLVGCGVPQISASATSSTIISDPFTATTVPTTSRIVVFEENVGTPSLNTDIIASISRNGGTDFTTATLTDSGYVTGSSGQRILTGTATISGQPSGQSMKWKLQLANNTVKIHGVALQWK
jgi:hypothetical protein